MVLHSKGWEVTDAPSWLSYDHDRYIMFKINADTPSAAKYKFIREWCSDLYRKDRVKVMLSLKVRRNKYGDLFSVEPHPVIAELSKNQIDRMKHCWGFDTERPGYRNYYNCKTEPEWEDLVSRGIATKQNMNDGETYVYYSLTKLGIDVLRSLKPMLKEVATIYETEILKNKDAH